MKLKNKKTGEIIEFDAILPVKDVSGDSVAHLEYGSLAELNAEWEDYDEPKKHYEILAMGAVMEREDAEDEVFRNQGQREIGNYFESKEEAEKAVEKLKAFKRLKDKGFRFKNDSLDICCHTINFEVDRQFDMTDETSRDLHLLFGGEK